MFTSGLTRENTMRVLLRIDIMVFKKRKRQDKHQLVSRLFLARSINIARSIV